MILDANGAEGRAAVDMFMVACKSSAARSYATFALVDTCREAEMPRDEAAMVLIDAVVTSTKKSIETSHPPSHLNIPKMIAQLEDVLDSHARSGATTLPLENGVYGADFHQTVFTRVRELIEASVAKERASRAMFLFGTIIESDVERGALDLPAALQRCRELGHTPDDAAISLVDGAVSTAKQLRQQGSANELLVDGIAPLEETIDAYMRNTPPKFLPRNGSFARRPGPPERADPARADYAALSR